MAIFFFASLDISAFAFPDNSFCFSFHSDYSVADSVSPCVNPIINAHLDNMVAGHTYNATVGYTSDDNLQLAKGIVIKSVNDKIFLPDGKDCGNGCSYFAHFSVSEFDSSVTIQNVNDIYYLRLNIEHSFIGDLYINFSCPNGQHSTLLRKMLSSSTSDCLSAIPVSEIGWQGGAANQKNAFFGEPADYHDPDDYCDSSLNLNKSGIGWNYCWSENTNQGYQYANSAGSLIYRSANVHNGSVDSSNVAEGTQFYHPDESFENLIGCPINGTWTVEVIDGLSHDNGYIFSCEVVFANGILQNNIHPVDTILMNGLWLTQINDSSFSINPPYDLQNDTLVDFTFTVFDEAGCSYDTTLWVYVYANKYVDVYDTVLYNNLPYTWNNQTFTSAGSKNFETLTIHGADSVVTMHLSVVYEYDTAVCENDFPISWKGATFDNPDTVFLHNVIDNADSITILYVTSLTTNSINLEKTICSDSLPYTWEGETFYVQGIKQVVHQNIYGCDSLVTLSLKVVSPSGEYIDETVFENNLPYILNGVSYNEPGLYQQHLINHDGCDSIIFLNLSIIYNSYTQLDSSICFNLLPFSWNDEIFNATGTKVKTIIATNGADSIVTMHLTVNPNPEVHISGDSVICNNSECILSVDSGYNYLWSTGDTTNNISVSEQGLYSVTITNEFGCSTTAMRNIKKVVVAPIIKINTTDICVGNEQIITIGHDTTSTFVIDSPETTLSLTETIFLPDGTNCPPYGCSYQSPLTFTAFSDNAKIESVDDILYVKLNIEHSFAADLYINITCPNGQKADILRFNGSANSECSSNIPYSSRFWQSGNNSGGSTFFGMAYDFQDSPYCDASAYYNKPGIGWNYCWSNNTTENYQYAAGNGSLIYRAVNAHSHPYQYGDEFVTIFDSSNVAAGTQFYHPDQSFESLIGCPLNGSWYIEVMDGYNVDNGYVFGWELALAPHLLPVEYDDVTHVTVDGPWISNISNTSFSVNPPDTLKNDTIVNYLFHFFDDYGCSYDSSINLKFFVPDSTYIETSNCDSYTYNNITYSQSGLYKHYLTNSRGCDSLVCLNLTIYNSLSSNDTLYLVENQLPYHFIPSDTTFAANSPSQFQFSYHLSTINGCDSTINQKVIIYQNTFQTFDTTICVSDFPFSWKGHTFPAVGTFNDSALNANGSTNYLTFNIIADDLNITSGNVTHITCYGDANGAATMNVSGGLAPYTYKWTNSDGTSVSTTTHLSEAAAGNYVFTVTDARGCSASNSIVLNTLNGEILPGQILSSQEICFGEQLQQFTGSAIASTGNYQWQISDDGITWNVAPGLCTQQNYSYPTVPDSGFFYLRRAWISNACGTFYSDTLTINVLSQIYDTLFDVVCQNTEYQQNGFQISEDQTQNPGILTFTNTISTDKCDSIVTLILTVNSASEVLIEDEICEGAGYFLNGFNIPNAQTFNISEYSDDIFLQTINGCDSIIHLNLTIIDTNLSIINNTFDFCEDMSAELVVQTSMQNCIWNTGATTAQIIVKQSGTYSVVATEGACFNSKSITIDNCEWEIFLPNAISPSHKDNLNDYFLLPDLLLEQISSFEISIYNRWGEVVFHSYDKHFRWNGEVNGKIATENVFNYIIRYKNSYGKPEIIKGSLLVL